MKRLLTILALICVGLALRAQSAPEIKAIFSDFSSKDGSTTETIISGKALKGTDLELYRSLVINGSPAAADSLSSRITRCASSALSREVKYIGGKIYYAQFSLPPIASEPVNRYLFYLNSHLKGGNRQMVVYMSGKADLSQIKKLINQQ